MNKIIFETKIDIIIKTINKSRPCIFPGLYIEYKSFREYVNKIYLTSYMCLKESFIILKMQPKYQ